jgi:pilus assembly protein CpaE
MRALVVSPDPVTRSELVAAATRALPALAVDLLETWPDSAAIAARNPPADLCFLDISSHPSAAFGLLASLSAELPRLPVLAVVGAHQPDLVLQALRGGATEFLIRPFSPEELSSAVRKLRRFSLDPACADNSAAIGRLFVVLPGTAGCGATTVATSLAFALKRLRPGRLLLADLDGLAGTVGFLLKLKSNYSFLDAVKNSAALDRDMWKALAIPCHGIDVLLAPEAPVDCSAEALDPAPVLCSARHAYHTVVVDAGGALGGWNAALARAAGDLLLITTSELPATRATQRSLLYLADHEVVSKPRIVLNRYSPRGLLRREAVETALETEVFQTLPADPDAVQRALMEGRPPAPASAFAKAVTGLARALVIRAAPARQNARSFLGRLFAAFG